jgi:hypothetical protein
MAATTVRGAQVRDGTVQRADLDISTVGNAVVRKLVQGSNITLSSTGADAGTGDVTISAPAGGTGDVVGPSSSVDNEIALFSGTGGKTIKRATTTGILKATSGVIAAATLGTDYGNVSNNGTPSAGQWAQWVDADTIKGLAFASLVSGAVLSPAALAGVASKHFGMGGTIKITPSATGKILLMISGNLYTTGGAYSSQIFVLHGTGTAPTAGALQTGTAFNASTFQGNNAPYLSSCTFVARRDLVVGTAYWFDVCAIGGNAAASTNFTSVGYAISELP